MAGDADGKLGSTLRYFKAVRSRGVLTNDEDAVAQREAVALLAFF